mmetsp:Transcript_37299/g.51753  ORF Transcript_37299/g.51753 Transcript_37299/m.51753 type:complete len:220 (+) Transcript_37299:100-759(+)|eukprot:CAMPEP_0196574312 /NCGR_PEP_ID=MMETSP1081-20130531/4053_1 /TAXON_ID=36882 /ORGANISM="Pyramimonas amylifera, Strain CCMP720" /LENGTH=219 /DNA_ID=CAMNT_0041892297 /DNA_START=99 /DNA_END=758 /DNA_ORIENTATION=-
MPLDKDDEDLKERLRSKYEALAISSQQLAALEPGVDEAVIIAHQRKEDEERLAAMKTGRNVGSEAIRSLSSPTVEVRICPQCQGQKTIKEYYGHREMTKHCSHCDGEGTLTYGGPKPEKDESFPSYKTKGKKTEKAKDPRRVELKKLEKRITKYTKEARETERSLDLSKDNEECKLLQDLLNHLEAQITTVQNQLDEKTKEILPTTLTSVDELPPALVK